MLILPYLEADELYRRFKLDEPWDSPHNVTLLNQMPRTYAAPEIDDLKVEPYQTFYQVVIGPGAAFEGETGLRIPCDFPDGTASTLLVVEARDPVPWSKPADLAYRDGAPLPQVGGVFASEGRFSLLGDNRVRGFHVALGDGSVRFVAGAAPDEMLRALITRNGMDSLGREW